MPVLNGMPYLPETLESMRAQTFKDSEVLVWDNGSTDGTLEVLREWIPNRLPGRVITGRPLSLGNSLAGLVQESRTHYCIRVDADDISLPVRLERQFTHLESHPDEALNSTSFVRVSETGQPLNGRRWFPHSYTDILHELLLASRLSHPCTMFRRQAVLDVGNYRDLSDTNHQYWPEDYDLWQRLLSSHKGVAITDRLVLYRHQTKSLTFKQSQAGRQSSGRHAVFVENAPLFTGLSKEEARLLYSRTAPFALASLHRIAAHFSLRDGLSAMERWSNRSFLSSASHLTGSRDLLTRAWIALMSFWLKSKASLA